MKQKIIAVFIMLCVAVSAVSAFAFAAARLPYDVDLSKYSISMGNVAGTEFIDITAPWSGTLKSFDLEAGDEIEAGKTVFEMLETDVTAPENGTVSAIFAGKGENAAAAASVYGRIAALTPEKNIRIACTYSGAYNSDENKMAHIGEHVYFKDGNTESEGTVISADEKSFVVQVTGDDLKLGRSVNVYRDSQKTREKCIGSGRTVARPDDSIQAASGVVTEVVAPVGTKVKKDDTILRLSGQDADKGASAKIASPVGGIIAQLSVTPGQQVWKGQLLARVYNKEKLEVVAEMDEVLLKDIRLGDRLPVTFDAYPGSIFYGVVSKISSVGIKKQNAEYFNVHLKLDGYSPANTGDGVSGAGDMTFRIGQTASVYTLKDEYRTAAAQAE